MSDATESLFSEDARLVNAEEWLLRLDYSASKSADSPGVQKLQKHRLELVITVLTRILPDVAGVRFTSPTKEEPNPAVEFETPYGWVPLRQLGYGYRTMIAWIVDFASRMVNRYPDAPTRWPSRLSCWLTRSTSIFTPDGNENSSASSPSVFPTLSSSPQPTAP